MSTSPGVRIHDRPGPHRIAGDAVGVHVVLHGHGAQISRLMVAFALGDVRFLAMEIRRLDLGAGEVRLQEVVLREQIGILQPQALLEPAGIGVGLYPDGGHALFKEGIPQREAVIECAMQLPALLTHVGDAECRDAEVPLTVMSRTVAKGKFSMVSPSGSSATWLRSVVRALGPHKPMQVKSSVRSSTSTSSPRSSAIRCIQT